MLPQNSFRLLPMFAIFSLSLSISTGVEAMVHGKQVDPAQTAPVGVAALEVLDASGDREAICTGIFIDDEFLLTARHCVDAGGLRISKIDGTPPTHEIAVPAAQIVASKDLDLAMVRVPGARQPHTLAIETSAPLSDTKSEVRGCGVTDEDLPAPSEEMREENIGSFTLFKFEADQVIYRARVTRDPYAVYGDSGSPVIDSRGFLLAIMVSYEVIDDQDQWGNNLIENRAIRLDTPTAQDFIVRARRALKP